MNQIDYKKQGKKNRAKGQRFEREVAKIMRERLDVNCRRSSQSAGAYSSDLIVKSFWVECKSGQRPNIPGAMEQAIGDLAKSGKNKKPIAVTKKDRSDVLVTMLMDDFLEIVKPWLEGQNELSNSDRVCGE